MRVNDDALSNNRTSGSLTVKRYLTTFVAVAMLVGLGLTIGCQRAVEPANDLGPPPPEVPPEDLTALVDGNNQFALDLYKKLAETEKGNIFFSPYSISSALAMTYAGARGQTAEEMAKVLGIAKLGDKVHPAHASLAYKLKSAGGKDKPEFHIANALWGQQGLPFKPDFLQLTRRHYGAGFKEVNFEDDTEGSRQTINKWVGEQTREKIPELLKSKDIDGTTKLVLTNAIYFKADWLHSFRKEDTKDELFHLTKADSVSVPLMRLNAELGYANVGDAELLEVPYAGRQFSMTVVLPKPDVTMSTLENALTADRVNLWLGRMKKRDVRFALPRFQGRTAVKLKNELSKMGMANGFTRKADFSGIAASPKMWIANVVHETFIAVDERGTEAAAATAVVMRGDGSNNEVLFQVDRPFVLIVRDTVTGCLLFVGRVIDPSNILHKI